MLIITSCSSQKLIITPPQLRADAIRSKTIDDYADKWVSRVNNEKSIFLPNQIYTGQAILAAQKAVEELKGKLVILSAGLSLVHAKSRIPSYNLTIGNEGPNPFDTIKERGTATDWWVSLNRAFGYENPLAKLIKFSRSTVIVALPASYLSMVMNELTELSPLVQKKLRIITSIKMKLPAELDAVAIRYDQRLNTAKNAPRGANASFTQRALLHFSRLLKKYPLVQNIDEQQYLVDQALGKSIQANAQKRKRMSDENLLKIMGSLLKKEMTGKTALLKVIRQQKHIACEQHRFNDLYDQVLKTRK